MKKLSKALKERNILHAVEIIKNGDFRMLLSELESFFQRDRLIIAHDASDSRLLRDDFLMAILNEFKKIPCQEIIALVEHTQETIKMAEEILDEIKQTLILCDFSRNGVEAQFWGVLRRIDTEFAHLQENARELLGQRPGYSSNFDFTSAQRISEPHRNFDPDGFLSTIISSATLSLKMMCHNNNYFHRDIAIAPGFIEVSDRVVYQAGSFGVLAAAWNNVNEHSKSCFSFGSEITKNHYEDKVVYILEKSQQALLLDAISYVAECRLMDKLHQKKLLADTGLEQGFLEIFEEILCVDTSQSIQEYSGLTLQEILKTYTAMQRFIQDANVDKSMFMTQQMIVSILINSGIPPNKIDASIGLMLFSKSSDDLFDTPLIKINQKEYYLITPAVKFLNIAKVALSRISALGHQIHSKGKNFENYVFKFFESQNFNPIKIKFKEKGEEYEYDLVFEFDGCIFLLECKNVSLPGISITGQLNHFDFIQDSVCQVHRLNEGLIKHKDIIRDRFNINVDDKKIIPIILNNLPYCIPGAIEGVYVTDFISFTKPIIQPYINKVVKDGSGIKFHPDIGLREDALKLRAIDLINNLDVPVIFNIAKQRLIYQPYRTPVASSVFIEYKITTVQ